MNMKLEVALIPVSDVDRAKAFYEKVGFRAQLVGLVRSLPERASERQPA